MESLSELQKAIEFDEKYGYDALADKDFDNMRNNAEYIEILRNFKDDILTIFIYVFLFVSVSIVFCLFSIIIFSFSCITTYYKNR